jgi:GTP-binding protein
MFVDEVQIYVKAGNGGPGCASFRREKFIPTGGPDGGDGGRGGSIFFIVDPSVDTLLDFSGRHDWIAQNGRPGEGKKKFGLNGEDLVIPVPLGTLVYDLKRDILIKDLNEAGMKVCICRGGRGGLGNVHFATATASAGIKTYGRCWPDWYAQCRQKYPVEPLFQGQT